MYKKVLVPLDGSALAEAALDHVRKLAQDGSLDEVVLLNVFLVTLPLGEVHYYQSIIDVGSLANDYLEKSKNYLAAVQDKLNSEGINVKTESIEGANPAAVIGEYVRQQGVDLIIMATHGYTGVKKMLLGSVAHQVLHESPVPVLLVRPAQERPQ
jgi:nucleotide-binding universal stress UspA family protein